MSLFRTRAGAALPAAVAALLAGGAAVYAVGPGHLPVVGPPPGAATAGTAATAADARELSGVFRTVAERVMPAVVSVDAEVAPASRPNVRRFRSDQLPPGFGGRMGGQLPPGLREMLEDDPRFEGFDIDRFDPQPMNPRGFRNEQNQLRRPGRTQSGSGVVIGAEGLILTNNHVVDGAQTVTVRFENGESYVAAEVLTDSDTDIAVLRLDPADLNGKTLPTVPMGDSSKTQIGDWVLAFGSPLGQQFSMTAGIISGAGRTADLSDRENYLQHDAAINMGNSGGPLVNLDGEIVGINTAISTRGGGYDGIGFAVPSNDAEWVADQLAETGAVTRAYLGLLTQSIDAATADALDLPGDAGALVLEVVPDSPAESAGVEVGDVVAELAGDAVADPRALRRQAEKLTVGRDYPLTVLRDGARTELTLTAGDLGEANLAAAPGARPRRSGRRGGDAAPGTAVPGFGLTLAPLEGAWRDRLGVGDAVRGAVVTEVDGPAAAAGLTPGLVVERLGRTDLTGEADLEQAVDDALARGADRGLVLLVTDPATDARRFVTLQQSADE